MTQEKSNSVGAGVANIRSMKPINRKMPSVAYIVARSNPGDVIGCENELPWRLKTDMKFFRSVTENHVVIMGRKTFMSLGRPLPKRLNIVISRNPGSNSENLLWANNPETALFLADFFSILNHRAQIIVIGGAQIYEMFSEQFTKIYLTEVFHRFECGDAYFHKRFDLREWDVVEQKFYEESEIDEYPFKISILEKKLRYTRHRDLQDFFVKSVSDQVKEKLPVFVERVRKADLPPDEQIKLPLMVA